MLLPARASCRGSGGFPGYVRCVMAKRFGVNKGKSASKFRSNVQRTKGANMRQIMRGGWRM